MKLTDKEIIEALKAGKQIKDARGFLYKLDKSSVVSDAETGNMLVVDVRALEMDFEIAEPEIDWAKIVREKYLCKFWDNDEEPDVNCRYGYLENYSFFSKSVFVDNYHKTYWNHCRPLRADEVKLVTDEKELWK